MLFFAFAICPLKQQEETPTQLDACRECCYLP